MIVIWEPRARKMLANATDYIAERSPQAADKLQSDVLAAANSLAEQPTKAPREPLLSGSDEEFRSLIVRRRYKLIYFVDEAADTVVIALFWDTKQQPLRLKNWFGKLRLLF